MRRWKRTIRDKSGSMLVIVLGLAIGVLLVAYTLATFAETAAVTRQVRDVGQLTLDRYTIQVGRTALQSLKNGHDYVPELRPALFLDDYRTALGVDTSNTGYYVDRPARPVRFRIRDISTHFVSGKECELKTQVSYTLEVPYYFLGIRLFVSNVPVLLQSQYFAKENMG